MRGYLAYIKSTLLLTLRDRMVLFFSYVFPLLFFFLFANTFKAGVGEGAITQVLGMVLVLGILGTGFFGGGMRATMEREFNILRRFKVAPISPAPILVASLVVGWVAFMPSALLFIVIAHLQYGMPWPRNPFGLFVLLSIGIIAFRSVGLIIASVVNSMAESQVIIQLLYLPMLMLSGATIPLRILPEWVQSAAQFLPATHLFLGMQSILVRGESILDNFGPISALFLTAVVACFLSYKLFRWEKEEKFKPQAKLWLLAVLAPFILIGVWQAHSKTNLAKNKQIDRELRRARKYLIRDARIFTGDGSVIERGAVLIRNGRIERIFDGVSPDAADLKAEPIEASGKTILPGLIDAEVDLAQSGGIPDPAGLTLSPERALDRALAAYLYAGVIAVRHTGKQDDATVLAAAARVHSGEDSGAEVFMGRQSVPALVTSLSALEAATQLSQGKLDWLDRSLVQQIGPAPLLQVTRNHLLEPNPMLPPEKLQQVAAQLPQMLAAIARARAEGRLIVAGTGSGIALLPHGAAIHRELQLLVSAGLTPTEALRAATSNAATFLRAGDRLGSVRAGFEASLLLVEANPVADISATERIFIVINKGEIVGRGDLFEEFDEKKK